MRELARSLILGGTGFVGSHVAELLSQEHEIIVSARSLSKERSLSSFRHLLRDVETADISKSSDLLRLLEGYRPDNIIHFAGQFTTYESFDRPHYDLNVNSTSVLRILEWMKRTKADCRLLLGSTFWVVGRPSRLPVDEMAPSAPLANYPAHRLLAEHYCSIYHRVFDLDTVVIRFSNGYGPREQCDNPKKAALNYLIMKAVRGEPFPIYEGGNFFRDYIYATDMASAAEAVLERGEPGETYFAGTGNKVYFKELADYIQEFTGTPYYFVESPDYHQRINVGNFVVNPAKLVRLGWKAEIEPKEGVRRTVDYCKELMTSGRQSGRTNP